MTSNLSPGTFVSSAAQKLKSDPTSPSSVSIKKSLLVFRLALLNMKKVSLELRMSNRITITFLDQGIRPDLRYILATLIDIQHKRVKLPFQDGQRTLIKVIDHLNEALRNLNGAANVLKSAPNPKDADALFKTEGYCIAYEKCFDESQLLLQTT